jgi:hypothetical protein
MRTTQAGPGLVALRLRIDSLTAEIVTAMRAEGIEPILLKGPVIARWLYAERPAERLYGDCDLLVSPADVERARELLRRRGFEVREHPLIGGDGHHARTYVRPRDGAAVDLHHTLHGMQTVAREKVWAMASRHTETMVLAGVSLTIPDAALRTLNVALHPEPEDRAASSAWRDLERALRRVGEEDWRAALAIARELGIEAELAARLCRTEAGAALAARLAIESGGPSRYELLGAVSDGRAPRAVISLDNLRARTGAAARLRYATAKLLPPAEQLRRESALARRGAAGLAASRIARAARVAAQLPGALIAYRRARTPRS